MNRENADMGSMGLRRSRVAGVWSTPRVAQRALLASGANPHAGRGLVSAMDVVCSVHPLGSRVAAQGEPMTTVKAAHAWNTNAELIADCAALGYIKQDDHVLDPTFGGGVWWRTFRPASLVTHNRNEDGIDFRDLPHADATFDVVAYDPPYVSVGGRDTSTIKTMHNAYGMNDAPKSPAELQQLINDGLDEVHRVLKPRGYALVKCQDYISSGRLWIGTHHTLTHALGLGFECIDRLEHITSPRPQPAHRRQVHARRNLSTLFVFRKGKSSQTTTIKGATNGKAKS
jgi:hypothetical protein